MPFCGKCGIKAHDSWNYCPMDATPLIKAPNSNKYNSDGTGKIHNPYLNNNNNNGR